MQNLNHSAGSDITEFSLRDERNLRRQNNPMWTEEWISMDSGAYLSRSADEGPRQDLRQTTRFGIRELMSREDEPPRPAFHPVSGEPQFNLPINPKDDEKERCPTLLRILLFILGVLTLIGLLLFVTITSDKDDRDKMGKVIPDPINYQICPDVDWSLSQSILITCQFNESHLLYDKLKKGVNGATVRTPNQKEYNLTEPTVTSVGKTVTWDMRIDVLRLECPMRGLWQMLLKFENDRNKENFSFNVRIHAPKLKTGTLTNGMATCSVDGACDIYDIKFVNNATQEFLNNRECTGLSTYNEGFSLSCNASLAGLSVAHRSDVKCVLLNTQGMTIDEKLIS